ncbi:hypothetical protein [Halorubrum sp. 48-1-W]|uniref:DUF7287 family protein n=1 Tax=Halorubrum sp. 48-1-W TaxID=2249761 RepID=UPI001F546A5C|nr:hypothetical protein [Halorubrum sp. 48-1-W]
MSGERPRRVAGVDGSRQATGVDGSRRDRRGQTQIDFAVGAGVFLLALAFVVAFVPTLFEPFAVADSASPLVSDRVADGAVDLFGVPANASGSAALHAPTEPGVLSPACTVAFFTANATLEDDAGCPFDAETDPDELFGIDGDVQVVVHELNETEPATNPVTVDLETRHGVVAGELRRSSADASTATDGVAVSGRVVSLQGTQYRLTVRVW